MSEEDAYDAAMIMMGAQIEMMIGRRRAIDEQLRWVAQRAQQNKKKEKYLKHGKQ